MARTNMTSTRVKPETAQLVTLRVLRSQRISPHFVRVTLGDGDIGQFKYLGFDQWFRLFIPVSDDSLSRLPNATKVNLPMYLKYLRIAKTDRPVLRNYSVRAFRPEGPELDVDFVVHGHGDDAGPAATWAQNCKTGDPVAVIDEGCGFNPDASLRRVTLVADESGLPAAAGILASLDADVTGRPSSRSRRRRRTGTASTRRRRGHVAAARRIIRDTGPVGAGRGDGTPAARRTVLRLGGRGTAAAHGFAQALGQERRAQAEHHVLRLLAHRQGRGLSQLQSRYFHSRYPGSVAQARFGPAISQPG